MRVSKKERNAEGVCTNCRKRWAKKAFIVEGGFHAELCEKCEKRHVLYTSPKRRRWWQR